MVAQYADESNLVGIRSPAEVPRKLEALQAHCERLGRDRSEIEVTMLVACNVAPTREQAEAELRAAAAVKGWNEQVIEIARGLIVHGDPDSVGEELQAYKAAGLDGLVVSLVANGHVPERVSLLGEVARRALD